MLYIVTGEPAVLHVNLLNQETTADDDDDDTDWSLVILNDSKFFTCFS